MTKLQKLYSSIESLKELGVKLPSELIEETNRVEEDIIKNEVIPTLAKEITPIISQIQRELVLVIDYIPEEPLQVRMTRKRSLKLTEEEEKVFEKNETKKKETSFTLAYHTKSKKTNLQVAFPDGTVLNNRFAYQTLLETIEKIGPEQVRKLGLKQSGIELVSKNEDEFYNQHKVKGGYWVMTHSSTALKKKHLDEISKRLKLKLKVKIV
jgi:hypothetical protein